MNRWQRLSQLCILLLIGIAATVAGLLIAGKSAWFVIIVYWLVLTGKNVCDWLGR